MPTHGARISDDGCVKQQPGQRFIKTLGFARSIGRENPLLTQFMTCPSLLQVEGPSIAVVLDVKRRHVQSRSQAHGVYYLPHR